MSSRRGIQTFILLAALVSFTCQAAAQNAVTPGSLNLLSTFEAISVRAKFSGDANGNATAAVQYRPSGTATWRNAYTPYIDRRATVPSGGNANPYVNEARVSIVGLTANTSYDVRVTWSDPDGISGSLPGLATVSTLSYEPPTGGTTIAVTNDATLAAALTTVNPGQTIHLQSGVYAPFSISRSGTPSAWIVIEGESGVVVTGAGVNQNIFVGANYVVVKNLTLGPSDFQGIIVQVGAHDIYIQDNVMQNISARCADNPVAHYNDSGINITNSTNVYVLRNTITSTSLGQSACLSVQGGGTFTGGSWADNPGTGIAWGGGTSLVFTGNTVTGAFRDAITSDNSGIRGENIDMNGNTVQGYLDDGIEGKGTNINVRMWSNTIIADHADTCIAGNTNSPFPGYGPLYVFRNICRATTTTSPTGNTAWKGGGAPTWLFHNTFDTSAASPRWDNYVTGEIYAYNNIAKSSGTMIDYAPATSVFDYNLSVITTPGVYWTYKWNLTTSYVTFSDFQAGTGQEAHGLVADPEFVDSALHIDASSPAVDHGVVLNGFNSLDSAWPYVGSAPDIGAYELGATFGLGGTGGNTHGLSAPTGLTVR